MVPCMKSLGKMKTYHFAINKLLKWESYLHSLVQRFLIFVGEKSVDKSVDYDSKISEMFYLDAKDEPFVCFACMEDFKGLHLYITRFTDQFSKGRSLSA